MSIQLYIFSYRYILNWLIILNSNIIAGIVSQNCGRQPHIVSTNHSNLIAVGPIRSLASRQAIVWTYRPRVEESQSPDLLSSLIETMKRKTNKLSFEISSFQFWSSSDDWKMNTKIKIALQVKFYFVINLYFFVN